MARPIQRSLMLFLSCCAALLAGCSQPVASQPSATAGAAVKNESPEEGEASFYTVSSYSESRDPAVDLADTIKRATAEDKRILLQVGGEWCGWCKLISQYMHDNQAVNELLTKHFVVMKVTFPGEHADAFLKQFPKCEAYPQFFVLDRDGTFLHSQGTGELEAGKGYDEAKFTAFLNAWTIK